MHSVKPALALLLFSILMSSEAQKPSEYQIVNGFRYLETVLNASNSTEADLPVIIGFHYSSSTPQEAVGDYDQIKQPVRLILPQGNFRKRSGFSYFPPDYYIKDSLTQIGISKMTVDSIALFVKAIGDKFNRKPIVAGFSQGGDLSFLLAVYYPTLIRAAFPLAGFIHRQRWNDARLQGQKETPIVIYLGEDDKIVSAAYSRQEVNALKTHFTISLKTYPALGHDFSPAMKKDYADLMIKVLNEN
jgi:pimeloyl-ACP methyl ester carboxylesterase